MPTEPIKLITHHTTGLKDDQLHYSDYAYRLVDLLTHLYSENAGLTIGIFGDWGSGKSSILRMIKEILKSKKDLAGKDISRYLVIEFDAWRYGDQQYLWVAFLRKILQTIEDELGPLKIIYVNARIWFSHLDRKTITNGIISFLIRLVVAICFVYLIFELISRFIPPLIVGQYDAVLLWFKDALEVASLSAVVWVFFSASILQIYSGFKKIFTFKLILPPEIKKPSLNMGLMSLADQFQQDLVTIVDTVGKSYPIIVLIDDLDRAPLDQIVPVLESMKQFGLKSHDSSESNAKSRIAFVLAADRRTIERAIASHYDKFWAQLDQADIKDMYAREYFEKIVQIFFELPPLSSNQLNELLKDDDQEANLHENIGSLKWARQEAKQVFTQGPKQNPREVIQAYNSFQYLWGIIQSRNISRTNNNWFPQLLATLTIIRYIWPSVFEKIVRWPELFFDLHGIASSTANQICCRTEIEEFLTIGCPGDDNNSMIDIIKQKYPDLLKLLGVVDIKDLSLDLLYEVITLSKDQFAPKGWHLIEVGEALMSGDPSLIKFAKRTNSGDVMKDRVIWLMEFLREKTILQKDDASKRVDDIEAENKMIRAIFALGRLDDPRAIEPLKKVVDARINHSDEVIARTVFALAHLSDERS